MLLQFQNLWSAAVLDGARMGRELAELRKDIPRNVSLYRGEIDREMESVAPYIFMCRRDADFNRWITGSGWGKSCGILILSDATIDELQKHFRRFLIVRDEAGRKLYFRFYDPRVLRVFLPTCTPQQLKDLFGPVESYLIEDGDPRYALLFYLRRGELQKEVLDLQVENYQEPEFLQRKRSRVPDARTIV